MRDQLREVGEAVMSHLIGGTRDEKAAGIALREGMPSDTLIGERIIEIGYFYILNHIKKKSKRGEEKIKKGG